MEERQSRRVFLGVGLGCAAPLLLGMPLAETMDRTRQRPAPRGATDDAVLEHLRAEALRNYHVTRAAADGPGGVPGEPLRALGAHLGLLDAYLVGKGHDRRLDGDLRRRVAREGRDAAAQRLLDEYGAVRQAVEGHDGGVRLPAPPDFTTAVAAVEFLEKRGLGRSTKLLRQWSELEAKRADRAGGRPAGRRAARQKPGDDFGGYPEPNVSFGCEQLAILIDSYCLAAALAALVGGWPIAEVFAVIAATLTMVRDLSCAPMTA